MNTDWRATYAARFVDRITLRPSGLFWPVGPPKGSLAELRAEAERPVVATVVEAWAEWWGAYLHPLGEDQRRAG